MIFCRNLILFNKEASIISLNDAAATSLGGKKDSLIGTNALTLVSADVAEKRYTFLQETIDTKRPTHFEDERAGRFFRSTYYPIFDDKKNVKMVLLNAQDITQKKLEYEEILRIKKAIESSNDAIIVGDKNVKPLFSNPATIKLLGYQIEELRLLEFSDLFENQKKINNIFRKLIESGTWSGMLKVITRTQEIKHVLVHADTVRDDNNKTVGYIAIIRDISDEIKAQKERSIYLRKLANTEKLALLGQFAGSLAHQINNPLDVISSLLFSIKKSVQKNEDRKSISNLIGEVEQQFNYITNIMKNILNYAKPTPIIFKKTDIQELLRQAVNSLSQKFDVKERITLNLQESMLSIEADPIGLEIVLTNIIQNAIEAGDEKFEMTIISEIVNDEFVQLKFKDNGIGIKKTELKNVLEALYTTKRDTGGTGLGLAISKKIIEQHQGQIQIFSQYQKGTTVILKLPLNQ